MLIDFHEMKEITMPGMNQGTGTMAAKLYRDEQGKIISCAIHPGGSIGLHRNGLFFYKKFNFLNRSVFSSM